MLKAMVILVLIVIIALPIVASQLMPWWGLLAVLIAEIVVLASLGPRLIAFGIKRYLLGLFRRKSVVLRGASAQVHAMSLVEKPQDETEGADRPMRYVEVEFTLTPKPAAGEMQYYDPSDLLLVPFDAPVNTNQDPTAEDLASGVVRVGLVEGPDGQVSEVEKLTGEARLKVVFACPAEFTGRAKMRYYFEDFGELMLP